MTKTSWKILNSGVTLRLDRRAQTIRQMPKAKMHNMQKIIGIEHGRKGYVKDFMRNVSHNLG